MFETALLRSAMMKLSRPLSARPHTRSGRVIRPSLLILAAVVFLPILFIGGRSVFGDRARSERIVSLLEQLESERAEAFRQSGGGTAYMEQMQKSRIETLQKISEIATGNAPMDVLGRALVDLHERTRDDEMRYAELVSAAERTNAFDGTNARSAEELQRRIGGVNEMIELSKRMADATNRFPGDVRTQLGQTGASKREIDRMMTQFVRGFSGSGAVEAMRLETRILELSRDSLTLLKDSWGRWSVQGGELIFENDRDVDRFNAIVTELDQTIRRQAGIMGGG
jgi:hypothetical protein